MLHIGGAAKCHDHANFCHHPDGTDQFRISSWKNNKPYSEKKILTSAETGENEPKCAVYFRRGAESDSSFGLLNYFL